MGAVLVLGAGGYIGSAVAKEFARKGYKTYGLTRKADKASALAVDGVIPIVGDLGQPEGWKKQAQEALIWVNAAIDYADPKPAQTAFAELAAIAAAAPGKHVILQTSGAWAFGNNPLPAPAHNEFSPYANQGLAWRFDIDNGYLNNKNWRGVVVIPPSIYGGSSSLIGHGLLSQVVNGTEFKLASFDDGNQYVPLVHIDDLADAYVKAAESDYHGRLVVSEGNYVYRNIIEAAFATEGKKGTIHAAPPAKGDFGGFGVSLNLRLDNTVARTKLGWYPRHHFVRSLPSTLAAYKAHAAAKKA